MRKLTASPNPLGPFVRLHREEGGQSAVAFLLLLLVLLMFFALAFDSGIWYFDHRRAQNEVEAAATAALDSLPSADTTQAGLDADDWLRRNWANPVLHRTCLDFLPRADGLYDTVRVCIRRPSQGFFSALSGIPFVWVSAAATARVAEIPAPYSLMAMNESACDTLYVFGGADVGVTGGGGSYTRSTCDSALHVQGTATLMGSVNDTVSGQGATTGAGAVLLADPTWQEYLDDPYGSLLQPLPGPCKLAGDYNLLTLTPGTYCNQLNVNNQRGMAPGLYIFLQGIRVGAGGGLSSDLDNDGLEPGEGVLLYNTCPISPCNGLIPDDMRFEGSGELELQGLPAYENIVLWVDRTAGCCPGSVVRFRGSSAGGMEGRVYALHSTVDIGGTPAVQLTLNMSIVADQISFQGDATFTVPYDPLLAPVLRVLSLIE